jgi:D-alanyl-D-alanine carboxypeptidase
VSTANELVLLGHAALSDPTLARLVRTTEATLPGGLVVHNLDTLLTGEPGWLGIKTGWASWSGGCLLFAASRQPPDNLGGPPVTLIGAVLGQPRRADALDAARAAVGSALAGYSSVFPGAATPLRDGSVTTAWGSRAAAGVHGAEWASTLSVRRGTVMSLRVSAGALRVPLHHGDEVGVIVGTVDGLVVARWLVRLEADLGPPSWRWRLLHG